MARLQQGMVLWGDLPTPAGRRPVLILTRDSALRRLNAVTVAPITRTVRNLPTEVVLQPADGLPTTCVVSLDNIFTLERKALGEPIAILNREKVPSIFAAIRVAFDMG